MIVVFVVDTSPSMGEQIITSTSSSTTKSANDKNKNGSVTTTPTCGMSKLDMAKMTVESISKMMEKRIHEHNAKVQEQQQQNQSQAYSIGMNSGYSIPDQFLLLTTGRKQEQHQNQRSPLPSSSSAVCGAGGRLLVGFGEYNETNQHQHQQQQGTHHQHLQQQNQKHEAFEKELKLLKATTWSKHGEGGTAATPFPEDGGGAVGLNIALSTGLQLLSRYRLHNSTTENFGMGRLPSKHILVPNNIGGPNNNSNLAGSSGVGGRIGIGSNNAPGKQQQSSQQSPPGTLVQAVNALQPACLILLTDGECLRRPRSEGGGSLQLQFNLPLREFYRERKFSISVYFYQRLKPNQLCIYHYEYSVSMFCIFLTTSFYLSPIYN